MKLNVPTHLIKCINKINKGSIFFWTLNLALYYDVNKEDFINVYILLVVHYVLAADMEKQYPKAEIRNLAERPSTKFYGPLIYLYEYTFTLY